MSLPTVARHVVHIAHIALGGGQPVVVQSMTNTRTDKIQETVDQVFALARAGSELVRITVNDEAAAASVTEIRRQLDGRGCDVPLIGDFHFNGHKLLSRYPECAQALAKYRINPGNVGKGSKREGQFAEMIALAIRYGKPVRIGVNGGSLDQDLLNRLMDENAAAKTPDTAAAIFNEALIRSVLSSAEQAVRLGLPEDRIVLSCKVSNVQQLIAVHEKLSLMSRWPIHLGLTEAGMGSKGVVASTAALAVLLQQGIGDTIRLSLTPEPGGDRCQEVRVAQQILQSMGLRSFTPQVIACPGCGRTSSDFFQHLAKQIQTYLVQQMPLWKQTYPGVEGMSVAVMGCVVNGPGESRQANIGISLPGDGERPVAPVYIDGKNAHTLKGDDIPQQFQRILADYVAQHYAPTP